MSSARQLAILTQGLQLLGIATDTAEDQAALRRICLYYAELRKWNRSINLVAAAPEREQLETHFLDSLTLWPLIASRGDAAKPLSLLDVGSGAGFPGLVLKCWRPEALIVTLLEPRLKRVFFLRQVVRALGLKGGIRVLAQRLEPEEGQEPCQAEARAWSKTKKAQQAFRDPAAGQIPDKNSTLASSVSPSGDKFTLISSRAFTSISSFLTLCSPLSPPDGLVVCMKGPRAEQELNHWRQEQPHSPFLLAEVRTFLLPFSGARRNLLIFRKQVA